MEMKFVIPGNPSSRVKMKRPSNLKIWDDYKRESFSIRRFIEDQMGTNKPLSGPLSLELSFFMPCPRTIPRKMLNSYMMGKPYVDNMIRMYLDCLEGLVFEGHQNVASLKASKVYDSIPRTEVIIVKV